VAIIEEAGRLSEIGELRPSNPSAAQSTWLNEQAQGFVENTSLKRSRKRRSNAALCAMMSEAGAANLATSAGSMTWPATISFVMPVIAVISGAIGSLG
jgi:hypothetical protein